MNNEVFPFFRTLFVDYQNRLRCLDVESSVDPDGEFYFLCIVDERKAYALRIEADGRWHDRYDGPTPLADELGSVIESKMQDDNE
jgi:hypothetical protein